VTKSKDERRKEEQLSRNLTFRLYGPRLTNAAERLAAQQMLQRGGCHRRQGQAPGVPAHCCRPPAAGRRDGVPVCPDAEADYLRAISSYPSSQAMQAEASRIWHTALPW
jgi:hypothetical protein